MRKFRFLGKFTGLLVLSAVFIAPAAAQSGRNNRGGRNDPGLTITGLGAFEGSYVIAAGKAGGTSYTAFSNTMEGGQISDGEVTLLVYGDGTRVFTGDAEVTFDVVINADAPVKSETIGYGQVTARFRNGVGSGAITGLLDMRKKSAAPAVKGALPVEDVVEYITVRASIDGKNKYYLSSLSGEIFDFHKTTYEYSTPVTDEIYIFPTRKTDAMLSNLSGGPKYTTTVNDIESKSPYTYPLKRGANTFLVKYLENTRVIRTYTINITAGGAPAPTPAAPAPTPAPRPATPAPTPAASAGSFDYRTIADNGIITAVSSAANARTKGQVFISGTTLTTTGGEQKVLNAARDANLIAIAADDSADVGRGRMSGWSKVQSLTVDGSNVIQEITTVPATNAASQLTVGILNNFLKSAKKVSIPGEKNGYHLLACTQQQADRNAAQWTITIPAGTALNLKAPVSGSAPVITINGYLTLVVNGTVTGENNNGKISVADTVTIKRGSRSGKGPGGATGLTASAFQSFVNGL